MPLLRPPPRPRPHRWATPAAFLGCLVGSRGGSWASRGLVPAVLLWFPWLLEGELQGDHRSPSSCSLDRLHGHALRLSSARALGRPHPLELRSLPRGSCLGWWASALEDLPWLWFILCSLDACCFQSREAGGALSMSEDWSSLFFFKVFYHCSCVVPLFFCQMTFYLVFDTKRLSGA